MHVTKSCLQQSRLTHQAVVQQYTQCSSQQRCPQRQRLKLCNRGKRRPALLPLQLDCVGNSTVVSIYKSHQTWCNVQNSRQQPGKHGESCGKNHRVEYNRNTVLSVATPPPVLQVLHCIVLPCTAMLYSVLQCSTVLSCIQRVQSRHFNHTSPPRLLDFNSCNCLHTFSCRVSQYGLTTKEWVL